MELYHKKGRYSFLEMRPYWSNLEEAIAQTALSNSHSQRSIRSLDCNYITPANIMLELIRCHCKGKVSGLEFCSSTGGNGVSELYNTRPIGVGLRQRSQQALELSYETLCRSWRWSQANGIWQTYRCLPSILPRKWFEGQQQLCQHM